MGLGPATFCVWPEKSGRVVHTGAEEAVGSLGAAAPAGRGLRELVLREHRTAGLPSGPGAPTNRCADFGDAISPFCVQLSPNSNRKWRPALSFCDGGEGSTGDRGPSRGPRRRAVSRPRAARGCEHSPREGEEETAPAVPRQEGFPSYVIRQEWL